MVESSQNVKKNMLTQLRDQCVTYCEWALR